jgi:hypothetical protein
MARTTLIALLCFLTFAPFSNASIIASTSMPDPEETPGYLCTTGDKDFDKLYYNEQIARCTRHVTKSMKKKVAEFYGIPESKWEKYEFDHLIPLCAGGSNDTRNLFPQPWKEADKKDVIENKVCRGMRNGDMTQEQAVRAIKDFFEKRGIHVLPTVE